MAGRPHPLCADGEGELLPAAGVAGAGGGHVPGGAAPQPVLRGGRGRPVGGDPHPAGAERHRRETAVQPLAAGARRRGTCSGFDCRQNGAAIAVKQGQALPFQARFLQSAIPELCFLLPEG